MTPEKFLLQRLGITEARDALHLSKVIDDMGIEVTMDTIPEIIEMYRKSKALPRDIRLRRVMSEMPAYVPREVVKLVNPRDTYTPGYTAIQPYYDPSADIERAYKSAITADYVLIDSRDRDMTQYPEPGFYRVDIPVFTKVYKVGVSYAMIPDNQYVVQDVDSVIEFLDGGARRLAAVTPGDYTIPDLLVATEVAMNSAGSSNYTVSLVSGRVRITSDLTGGSFSIRTGGLGRLLGFTTDTGVAAIQDAATGLALIGQVRSLELDIPEVTRGDDPILVVPGKNRALREYIYPRPISVEKLTIELDLNTHGHDHFIILAIYHT